jgi:hypothetical protein
LVWPETEEEEGGGSGTPNHLGGFVAHLLEITMEVLISPKSSSFGRNRGEKMAIRVSSKWKQR